MVGEKIVAAYVKAVMQKDVFFLPYNQAWLKMEVLLLHEAP